MTKQSTDKFRVGRTFVHDSRIGPLEQADVRVSAYRQPTGVPTDIHCSQFLGKARGQFHFNGRPSGLPVQQGTNAKDRVSAHGLSEVE